jgi:lysophospholipase L1-like esterase
MLRRLNPWFVDMRFKRRDYLGAHPDTRRVVVLGGSQTFGWGIPSEDRMTFSDRLADALFSRGYHDVEVMNAAFPGVKTTTGLRWLEGVAMRYQPDVVVINFVVNEFMDVDPYNVWSGDHGPDERVAPAAALSWLRRLPRDIHCSHLVQIVLAHNYEILEMEESLRRIVELARSRGVKVVFSVEPTNIYVESAGEVIMRNDADIGAAVAVYERLGAELGVPVYNVLPHFQEEADNLWFYDTMHMSRLGHGVFAENLAAVIDRDVFGGAPPPAESPATPAAGSSEND